MNTQDLKNLLKEKEKGCEKEFCGCLLTNTIDEVHYCDKCQAEISILKQALSVIENERKEILDNLVIKIKENRIYSKQQIRQFKEGIDWVLEVIEELKQQLSQPNQSQISTGVYGAKKPKETISGVPSYKPETLSDTIQSKEQIQ